MTDPMVKARLIRRFKELNETELNLGVGLQEGKVREAERGEARSSDPDIGK